MRTAKKNKVHLLYSLPTSEEIPIYEKDSEGNVVYEDGVPIETGDYFTGYQEPVSFYGNLSFYTGWNYPGVWGVTLNNADAILLMDKDELPIDETARIWFNSEPAYVEYDGVNIVNPDSADFSVSRIIPSLNHVRYVLKGVEK